MGERPGLLATPGLCGVCRHAKHTTTRRGTTYLRCTRAEWDLRLRRYPALPVHACVGFEREDDAAGSAAPPPGAPAGS